MSERSGTSLNIYLDANAGAPLRAETREALFAFFPFLFNPSSVHVQGRKARKLLNDARESVARSLGERTSPDQILFTSSGTEAGQMAIRAALEPALLRGEKPHLITTPVEHEATLKMEAWLRERGGSVSFLPVDSEGRPEVRRLSEFLTPSTRLASVIWANNETGVLTDVGALVEETRKARIPLHLDGAQAWGKLPLELAGLGAEFVSFSGAKIGALSGTGVLWSKDPKSLSPASALMPGSQERRLRGGTENLLGILSLGVAASRLDPRAFSDRIAPAIRKLEEEIRMKIPDVLINGEKAPRIANTSNLSFPGIEKAGLVAALDLRGFSVSAGSACSSGITQPSHVLLALGRSPGLAQASIRISLCEGISEETSGCFVKALAECVFKMRNSGS